MLLILALRHHGRSEAHDAVSCQWEVAHHECRLVVHEVEVEGASEETCREVELSADLIGPSSRRAPSARRQRSHASPADEL